MSKHTSHEKKHDEEHSSHEKMEKVQDEQDQMKQGSAAEENQSSKTGEKDGPADKTAALEAELTEMKDQYLRKAAEFENFRKRMAREKQEAIDYANQSLLLDIIPIIDDFERAIKSAETSKDFSSFYEGVSMIEKRLVSQLETKWGLKRYESANQPFNPEIHEAIMMDKSADVSEPTVEEDFLKGYLLKDRVVRSAKVKVLMPQDKKADGAGPDVPDGESAGPEKDQANN